MILRQLNMVEVTASSRYLPDQIEVDASVLAEEGDRLTVADLKVPEGVTIITEPEHVIATVEMPKDQIAAADQSQADLAENAGKAAEAPAAEAPDATPASDSK